MKKLTTIVPFPSGAESDPFIAALSSAAVPLSDMTKTHRISVLQMTATANTAAPAVTIC